MKLDFKPTGLQKLVDQAHAFPLFTHVSYSNMMLDVIIIQRKDFLCNLLACPWWPKAQLIGKVFCSLNQTQSSTLGEYSTNNFDQNIMPLTVCLPDSLDYFWYPFLSMTFIQILQVLKNESAIGASNGFMYMFLTLIKAIFSW